MAYGPSKSNRGAGNPGSQPVTFTLGDAQRIGDVVRIVETGRRGRIGSSLPRATGGGGGGSGGIMLASFTGTWWKGTEKVVTILESPVTSTASAVNVLANIASKPGPPRKCYVAVSGTAALSLIAAECV